MGTLSNFLRLLDGSGSTAKSLAPLIYHPATPEQVHPSLRLVLGGDGRAADEGIVDDFLRFAVQRGVDLNDLWVADRDGRIVWATLAIVSPGRTMLLVVPGGQPRGEPVGDVAGTLAAAVVEHFSTRGVLMAQVLLDPADAAGYDAYVARAFRRMAELLYLQAELRRALPPPPLSEGFSWSTYSAATHAAFGDAIARSYVDSLDCPALNGLRDIEDVMAGHKTSGGGFDPVWWFLLREGEQPVGVLLLARSATASGDTAELVYLGLVPAARGRGLADVLMRQALHVTSTARCASLALAVDSQNGPALRLYHRHGMRRIGSKIALMRDLRPAIDPLDRAALDDDRRATDVPC